MLLALAPLLWDWETQPHLYQAQSINLYQAATIHTVQASCIRNRYPMFHSSKSVWLTNDLVFIVKIPPAVQELLPPAFPEKIGDLEHASQIPISTSKDNSTNDSPHALHDEKNVEPRPAWWSQFDSASRT
jgi:hypothetical protein